MGALAVFLAFYAEGYARDYIKGAEVLRKMNKEEAIALQAAVDEILALAVEKQSQIGGAVNWGGLLCLDVEVSLLDGIVKVTVEGAAPEAVELCRFVSEELAGRGYSGIAVRTEW